MASGQAWATTVVSTAEASAQGAPFSFVMSAADIPTLGEWAAILLMLVMGAYAVRRLRRSGVLAGGVLALLVLASSSALLAVSALSNATHDPATMLAAPLGHFRDASVSLTPSAGQTVTAMTLHYRKAGGAWRSATGAADASACPDCWTATMDTTGWLVNDVVHYYFEATAGGVATFVHRDPCGDHGAFTNGACVCNTGWAGTLCTTCDTGSGYGMFEGLCALPDDAVHCSGHGTAKVAGGNIICNPCDTGYAGARCATCAVNYGLYNGACVLPNNATHCSSHGTASVSGGNVVCACSTGWAGADCSNCDTANGYGLYNGACVLPNDNAHCDGHGTASVSNGNVVCACQAGYAGATCNACDTGYMGYPSCVDDPCIPDPCNGHATSCNQSNGACTCASGYHGATCAFACNDSQQNGTETGVDCGGPCPSCTCGQPTDPSNGSYASCANTPNGGTCVLTCNAGYVKSGDATCTSGAWNTQTCTSLPGAGGYLYVPQLTGDVVKCPLAADFTIQAPCTASGAGVSRAYGVTINGRYAYITSYYDNSLTLCQLSAGGTLGSCSTLALTLSNPTQVAFNGSTAYIGEYAGYIQVCTVSAVDGTLSSCSRQYFTGGAPNHYHGIAYNNGQIYATRIFQQRIDRCSGGSCVTAVSNPDAIGVTFKGSMAYYTGLGAIAGQTYVKSCTLDGSGNFTSCQGVAGSFTNPQGVIAVGDKLHVTNNGTPVVSTCTIGGDGRLSGCANTSVGSSGLVYPGYWDGTLPPPCQSSPTNPSNGTYANCANTPSGGTCALTCNSGYTKSGDATCTDGSWNTQTCTAMTYAVTYDANGATSGTAPSAQTKTHGVDLTLATNSGSLVKSSCSFNGWNTAANGGGISYAAGATYTGNTALNLFANWSCTPPMVDNGNGTVTDPSSNLVWQKTPGPKRSWSDGVAYCAGNVAGLPGSGWRLPTISELRTLVRGCASLVTGSTCGVVDPGCLSGSCRGSNCDACGNVGSCYWDTAALGTSCTDYTWATSVVPEYGNWYWELHFGDGAMAYGGGGTLRDIRCVRTGP